MTTPIIFFGNSGFSLPVLKVLIDAVDLQILAVVTSPDQPSGRHLVPTPNPVKVAARSHHLQIIESLQELTLDWTTAVGSNQPIGLVAAFGRIIKPALLDRFAGRIYNLHPSMLPKYRGPSPLQFQILDQVASPGVSLIQMDNEIDHGPLVYQTTDRLLTTDTPETLGERLFSLGSEIFLRFVTHPQNFKLTPQNHSRATFTRLLTREDGFVPYHQFLSDLKVNDPELLVKFRAFYPWPGVWTTSPDGKRLKLSAISPQILIQPEGKHPIPLQQYRP